MDLYKSNDYLQLELTLCSWVPYIHKKKGGNINQLSYIAFSYFWFASQDASKIYINRSTVELLFEVKKKKKNVCPLPSM